MSSGTALLAALEHLNRTVAGIEQTIKKLEARGQQSMSSAHPKRRSDQMDLFSGAAPVSVSSRDLDVESVSQRLDRAIGQIETALRVA